MASKLTKTNVDHRSPVKKLVQKLRGKLVDDNGYTSHKLSADLLTQELHLITKLKKNIKYKFMHTTDRLLLKQRGVIESLNDQRKNICTLEHTRHRRLWSFMTNIYCCLSIL